MLHRTLVPCVALGMLAAFLGTDVAEAKQKVTLVGYVAACDEDCEYGCPATVITAEDVLYRVTNDEKGRQLAREADGCDAEVKGIVEEKDDDKWITVDSFKVLEVEEDPEE